MYVLEEKLDFSSLGEPFYTATLGAAWVQHALFPVSNLQKTTIATRAIVQLSRKS